MSDSELEQDTHQCPMEGCVVQVPDDLPIMCRQHWLQVPVALRNEVWRARKACLAGTLAERFYVMARQKAIDAVNASMAKENTLR